MLRERDKTNTAACSGAEKVTSRSQGHIESHRFKTPMARARVTTLQKDVTVMTVMAKSRYRLQITVVREVTT
jgi:hypothetical protein